MKKSSLALLFLALGSHCCVWASVSISTAALPNGTMKQPYSAVISTTGGCAPAKWTIASGLLPAGITMTASNKPISLSLAGTPTKAATYSFAIKVQGCGGGISTKSYTVKIQSAAVHVVSLSWNASTSQNIAGYNVYRSPDKATWKKVNVSMIASTLYSDSTVSNRSTYYYSATAVDISGHESSKAPAVKVTIP